MVADFRAELPFAVLLAGSAAVSFVAFGLFVICHVAAVSRAGGGGRALRIGRGMALFVSCYTATVFGVPWAGEVGAGPLVWPEAGIALAGLLIAGARLWPVIFLAYFAAARMTEAGLPLWVDAAVAAIVSAGATLAAKALRDWFPMDLRLTSVPDVVKLSLASLAAGGLSALVGAALLAAAGLASWDIAPRLAVNWGLGGAVGGLLLAAPLLAWSYRTSWKLSPRRWSLLLALLAATAAASYWVFFWTGPGPIGVWYTYPIVIWVAVAYQVRGASIALLIVTCVAIWSATQGAGPFANSVGTVMGHVSHAQQYTMLTAFSSLVLGAAADERRSVEALHRSEARENSIVDTAQEPIIVIDDRGRMVSFNRAAERSFGYQAEEVIGRNVRILMPEPDRSAHDGYMDHYHRTGEKRVIGRQVQVDGLRKDGSVFPLDLSVAEWSSDGTTFYTGIIHEQTERVHVETALRESEHRLTTAIEATGGGVYEQSVPAGDKLYVSPQWLAILGYDELPVRPQRFDAWLINQVHPDDREYRSEAWRAFIEGREPRYDAEVRKRHASGRWIWVRSYAQATELDAEGRVRRLSGMMLDITDRRAAETRAEHFARHDALTGLSNRALFTERLGEATAQADAAKAHAGLVLVDLDHFKQINDTMGHPVGDAVLRIVTERIRASIRSSDTASRLGGDEFAVVVAGARSRADIEELAERLHRAVSQPATIEGKEVPIEVSVGFASYPHDAETVGLLMRHADLALYEAKRRGRNEVAEFQPVLAAAASHRSRIEQELRRAVARKELVLHYQPQFDLSTGQVRSVEALVRWPRDGAAIAPEEFIPIAEQSGTIRALGAWVLSQAARQQAEWRAEGHEITVAVNVSPAEASAESFPPLLKRALAEADIPGDAIELEITEGLLIDPEEPSVQAFFAACKEQGIGLAIDDFGMGYSALNYLVNLPISKVKIDRSFVARLDDPKSATLLEGIVSLGHRLEKRIVAEGVETGAQQESLREMGCDDAQGFFLCKPIEADMMGRILRQQSAAARRARLH